MADTGHTFRWEKHEAGFACKIRQRLVHGTVGEPILKRTLILHRHSPISSKSSSLVPTFPVCGKVNRRPAACCVTCHLGKQSRGPGKPGWSRLDASLTYPGACSTCPAPQAFSPRQIRTWE